MYRSSQRDQVAFNLLIFQVKNLESLLKRTFRAYLNGDLEGWYWTLSGIREFINYDLNSNERKQLDAKEAAATELIKRIRKEKHPGIKITFAKEVKEYQRFLMDLLKDLGYFPKKEDRTKLSF